MHSIRADWFLKSGKSGAGLGGGQCASVCAMLLLLVAVSCACAAAAPLATYDQRQDGEFNVRADVQNVVLLVAIPQKAPLDLNSLSSLNLLDGFFKDAKQPEAELQDRADVQLMEAFVEPATPYRVDLSKERSAAGDGRAVEVVIAARRGAGGVEAELPEELKLLGATEQCGPGRERDPASLACRDRAAPAQPPQPSPPAQTVQLPAEPPQLAPKPASE